MGSSGAANMAVIKLVPVTLLLAIAFNLHHADAACRFDVPTNTAQQTMGSMWSVMSGTITAAGAATVETCTAACQACGAATVGTDTGANGMGPAPAYDTIAEMTAFAQSVCPTITYTVTQGVLAAAACPIGDPRLGAPASTLTQASAQEAGADGNSLQAINVAAIASCEGAALAVTAWADLAPAAAIFGQMCPCTTTTAMNAVSAACPVCGCAALGIPTAAPTAAPTLAPTSQSPTTTESWSYSSTDNELSGGAIAGIVIGSVVGAALIIGAGVMIGSK